MERYLPASLSIRVLPESEQKDDEFYIRAEVSNAKLDSHFSVMDPKTTLRNFLEDAKNGVALKDHHGQKSFGYGRSYAADLTEKNELLVDFAIVRDLKIKGSECFENTDDAIRAIEKGLITDVSVGFHSAREVCNICGRELPGWWHHDTKDNNRCKHTPGETYDIDGREKIATYTIYDARLKEVSLVEYGSNRHTKILDNRAFLEEIMNDKELLAGLRELLSESDSVDDDDPEKVLSKLKTELTELRSKNNILRKQADDGRAYRASLIEDAIAAGVRAFGDDFDTDFHTEYYRNVPIGTLKAFIEKNEEIAKGLLTGGRKTTDEPEGEPKADQTKETLKEFLEARKRR